MKNLTRRERYVLAKALAISVAVNAHLPIKYQVLFEIPDMQKLLDTLFDPLQKHLAQLEATLTAAEVEASYRDQD